MRSAPFFSFEKLKISNKLIEISRLLLRPGWNGLFELSRRRQEPGSE